MTIPCVPGRGGGADKRRLNQTMASMGEKAQYIRKEPGQETWIRVIDGDPTEYETLRLATIGHTPSTNYRPSAIESRESPASRLVSLAGTTQGAETQITRYCGEQMQLYSFREIRGLLIPAPQEEQTPTTSRDYTAHLFEGTHFPPSQERFFYQ